MQGGLRVSRLQAASRRTPTPGHQLQLVNGALFARCLWHDEIVMAFGTAENFLRHGIGLCLTAGEETCSEAYAVWRGAGRFEIGIVTAEATAAGYAFMACQHLIRLCSCAADVLGLLSRQRSLRRPRRKLGYQVEHADEWLYYDRTGATAQS